MKTMEVVYSPPPTGLDHAQEREQDRRRHAQRLVAGQDADQKVGMAIAATEKVSAVRRPKRSPI